MRVRWMIRCAPCIAGCHRICYVSLSLGLGGYLPRLPAQVVESRYGDCKDKATLFIAMARAMGVHAFPVLLSSNGNADSTVPTVQQFDHMIAAIDRPASGRLYLEWRLVLAQ